MSLQTILRELPQLDPADLEEVRNKTAAILSVTAPSLRTKSPQITATDYILDGVTHELRRRGLLADGVPLRAKQRWAASEEVSRNLRAHLAKRLTLSAAEQAALGRLLARALAGWLERSEIPVTPRTMLVHLERTLVALEQSFPGYLRSGLLPFCWQHNNG